MNRIKVILLALLCMGLAFSAEANDANETSQKELWERLVIFEQDGLQGYMDVMTGEVKIPARYPLGHSMPTFFSAGRAVVPHLEMKKKKYKVDSEKWDVINESGDVIFTVNQDNQFEIDGYLYCGDKRYDKMGNYLTVPGNFYPDSYCSDPKYKYDENGWHRIRGGHSYSTYWGPNHGYVDKDLNVVFPPDFYGRLDRFRNGIAVFFNCYSTKSSLGTYGLIDDKGNVLVEHVPDKALYHVPAYEYSDGILTASELFGGAATIMFDSLLNVIKVFDYKATGICLKSPFRHGLALAAKNSKPKFVQDYANTKMGYINTKGEVAIPFIYDFYGTKEFVDYGDGTPRAIVFKNQENYLILTDGTKDPNYTSLGIFDDYGDGRKVAKAKNLEKNWGVVDVDGNIVIPFAFTSMSYIYSNGAFYFEKGDDKRGIMKTNGEILASEEKNIFQGLSNFTVVCITDDYIVLDLKKFEKRKNGKGKLPPVILDFNGKVLNKPSL